MLTLKFSSDGSDNFYDYFRSIFEKNALECLKVKEKVTDAVLYAIAYAKMTLYTTATYSFLISFPVQLITFFCWSMHTEKKKTELKKMSLATKLITMAVIMGGFLFEGFWKDMGYSRTLAVYSSRFTHVCKKTKKRKTVRCVESDSNL